MSRKFYTGIDLQNNRGINVATPSTSTDAANKQYVDNLVNGLSWKNAVACATTTNQNLTTDFAAGHVIDGYTIQVNDRILVKNQTTASANGLYIAQNSGPPVISNDGATGELVSNTTVRVNNGSVNGDTAWTLITSGTITVGTTNQTWVQTNAGAPYSAGNGLQLSSTVFSVNAGTGITADGTGTHINSVVVPQKYIATIGNGTATTFNVVHGLGYQWVITSIANTSTGEVIDADVTNLNVNTVVITFAVAPSANAYTVTIIG